MSSTRQHRLSWGLVATAATGIGAIGWFVGLWATRVFVPEVRHVVLGAAAVLLTFLGWGTNDVLNTLKDLTKDLRAVPSPATARLVDGISRRRVRVTQARAAAVAIGIVAGIAGALLSKVPALSAAHPTLHNAAIARAITGVGFGALFLMVPAVYVAIATRLGLAAFEAEVRAIIDQERGRTALLAALDHRSIVPPMGPTHPLPIRYSDQMASAR